MSKKSSAAYTSARREFRNLYPATAPVVEALARGWDSATVADRLGTTVTSVAAVRANLTRGAYAPYVAGDVSSGFRGFCGF
jgi:hypothetical protein